MSAPTTAEVRERIGARLAMMRAADIKDGGGTAHQAYAWALTETALPIAEQRDALAAEVKTLREALEIACDWWGGCEHHPDDCPGVADECKAAKRVNELAAKGAGR